MHDLDAKRLGSLPNASGGITRLAYARAKGAGIDVGSLLMKAGLTPHQIEDPGARLKVRDQISFLNLAANALQDEFLGFHLAQSLDLREMGLLYYVSASSEMLSVALQRAARYSSVINQGVSLKYVDSKDVVIAFHYVGVSRHLDRHQIEFFMTALLRMCRQLTGHRLSPSRVSLTHWRDSTHSEFVKFFGGDVEFGANVDEVAFAPTIKQMPVVSADPTSIGTWSLILRKRSLVGQRTAAHFYQVLRTRLFRCCRMGRFEQAKSHVALDSANEP